MMRMAVLGLVLAVSARAEPGSTAPLELKLRRQVESEARSGRWNTVETRAQWAPARTAAVICDMWDKHWCKGASARVTEMAPRMNEFISALRERGVLIIHCPSETMKFYEGTPGRRLAQSAPKAATKVPLAGWSALDSKREAPLPIDDSDGGCDDVPQCSVSAVWSREIDTLEIKDGDAITDNAEAFNLMQQRGITNVMVMGVHQNMCVLGRPFSIRQLVRQGQNVILVRDLTDSLYNPRRAPYVGHFKGNELVTEHIEKYWCPTVTSDQVLGGKPFRFKER
jgi:nicotinamidase-related amidase